MLLIKRYKIIFLFVLLIILFTLFEMGKSTVAVKCEEIDKTKDYMICSLETATESQFSVLYDSRNRDIRNVNLNFWEQLYKFIGYFRGDIMGSLNKYVIYGKFDYDEKTHDILISNFEIRPIYPVKRDEYTEGNSELPKDFIYRYESSWIVNLFIDLV